MAERAQRPFWIHQFMEYAIGFTLIGFGFQDTNPTVPAIVGVVVLINAAVVRGPLGAFRFMGRKVHRWVDIAVMGFLAFAALQPWVEVSSLGRLALLALIVPFAFLWWYTDWEERPGRAQRRTERGSVKSEDIGKTAGRKAAEIYKAGKKAIDRSDS
jgi:hypothetical protein